jgi:hypothetical protein
MMIVVMMIINYDGDDGDDHTWKTQVAEKKVAINLIIYTGCSNGNTF